MGLLTGSWVIDSLLVIASILYMFYHYMTRTHGYFKARGVPYLRPTAIFRDKEDIFSKALIDQSQFLYNCFPGERYFGYFQNKEPMLLVKDSNLIHRILVKDFNHFQDRGFKMMGNLLSQNLFNMKGNIWRSLRNKLTPTFASGKLKLMFDQMDKSGDHLINTIEESCSAPLDTKTISLGYVTEVIASTAFGLDLSKGNTQTAEFLSRISSVYVTGYRMLLIYILGIVAPELVNVLGLSMFQKETEQYFLNLTKATKDYRKRNNIKREDYFQQLLTLQEEEESGQSVTSPTVCDKEEDLPINHLDYTPQNLQEKEYKLLTDKCLTAQTFGFLWGGSDALATIIMWALYHIARDPAVQKKLLQDVEVNLTKQPGWSYQAVKDMTYLDMVLQETLRLYPGNPLILRECTIPYHIPDSDLVLEKGAIVAIPARGVHMDPTFYPEPDTFNPERFVDNNHKSKATYMPFGDGPRICIAMRLAIVKMKVCLAKIISVYSIDVDKKTQNPVVFDPNSFQPSPLGGMWLNFTKRHQKIT